MFFRYHLPQNRRVTSKWKRYAVPPTTTIHREAYGDWNLEVTERKVGITVRRTQYRVRVRRDDLGIEHTLTGFFSLLAAQNAGQRWIDNHETRRRITARKRRASIHGRKNPAPTTDNAFRSTQLSSSAK